VTQPNPPEKVESLVERAGRQISLGRRTGADGGGVAPSNIYVIAAELVSRILALEAQVAGMGEALEAIETEAEREAVRWPHLKRVILIAARKARLAAAKEPS